MLEIVMKAHVFWDQMWTHIYVGRSMVAENAHRVLTVDTHLCLRSKVATHVHVCIGDQQQKYIRNQWWLYIYIGNQWRPCIYVGDH